MLYRCLRLLNSTEIKLLFLVSSFLSLYSCFPSSLLAETPHSSSSESKLAQSDSEQQDNVQQVQVFCTTALDTDELKKVLPQFAIDSQPPADSATSDLATESKAALSTSCPQQMITIKPLGENFIAPEDLEKIAQTITKLYIDRGYINSRAIPSGITPDNVSQIIVDEGKVEIIVEATTRVEGKTRVEETTRVKKYVKSRLELATNPLNIQNLEDQLRLLKTDPLLENIEATLQPAETENQTLLKVKVTEAPPVSGTVGIDNYSPPSVGSERFSLGLAYRNLAGLGDEITLGYTPRLENFGTYSLDFGYRVPINAMNGTIQTKASINRNEVIEGEFESLDISGESERYEISYRQPLVRNPREELALSVGFDYQDGQTFTFQGSTPFGFGPDEDGVSRTSVLSFGHDYIKRDTSGAWGWRSNFRWGIGIFDATDNDAPIPDGQFVSFLTQLQRVQVLNKRNFLIVQADLQATPNTLLPSEQFSLGGGQSVRGYRQNARSGDNGIRFSIEDRLTLVSNSEGDSTLVLAPFLDMGLVWQVAGNPNELPDRQFLIATGLGLLWQPLEKLNLRLDYAPPLIALDDFDDDIQDDGLYFSAGYSF